MNNIYKLAASHYLVKRAEITVSDSLLEGTTPGKFSYRPFNYKDSIPGGLAAAALGGLAGAGIGKLNDYFSSDEEELDPNSDDYGFKLYERMRGKSRKKPSSVASNALKGALALGLPVALAPALFGDNPIGRNLIDRIGSASFNSEDAKWMPEMLKDVLRKTYSLAPHSLKQLPMQNLSINF